MATIRCTVSTCRYWGDDNFCRADQILVTAPASLLPNVEKHGKGAEKLKTTPIKGFEDTLCYTFEAKSQG